MTEPGPYRGAGTTTGVLDPDAFAAQFQAAAPVLWTLAASVLGKSMAIEDVLQEAAMIGLRKRAQFQPGSSFLAWMGRVVRFVAQNHRRRERHRQPLVDPAVALGAASAVPATPPSPHDLCGNLLPDRGAFDDAMVAALQTLKPLARACLLLKVVADLEYAEIARTLAIPEGTAMSHVHRARAAMLEQLTLRGERS